MDVETTDSDMELEIKDEVKEEIIDEILKETQEALDNANLELKAEEGMDTEDPSHPPPPKTFATELNAVEGEFDGSPENGSRNSISKSKSIPTSNALQEHTLNLHSAVHDKRVKFPCVTCAGRNFFDQKSLDQHIKQNHISNVSVLLSRDQSLLECPHCPGLYFVQKDLNAHVKSEHTDPLEIDPLSTTTPSVGTETTLEISSSRHKHKCPHCPYTFLLSQSLQEHIIKLHVKHKAFPCYICARLKKSKVESFIDQQSLKHHINRSHSHVLVEETAESRLTCPHCDKTYSSKSHLKYHIKYTHSGPVPRPPRVQCAQCLLSFSRNSYLKVHRIACIKKHNESIGAETEPGPESLAKCPHCEIALSGRSSLAVHINSVHSESQTRVIKCPHCPLTFSLDEARKIHIQKLHKENSDSREGEGEPEPETEPGIRPLLNCVHCDATFPQESLLRQHMNQEHNSRSHPGIKCPCCPITFAHKMTLKNHFFKVHKENSQSCQGETEAETTASVGQDSATNSPPCCDDKCNGSICLTEYVKKLHKKTLQCPHCPKALSSRNALKVHVTVLHERHKAFPCPMCKNRKTLKDLVFPTQPELNRHMRLYHDPASLQKCPHCNRSFRTKLLLSNHILFFNHSKVPDKPLNSSIPDQQCILDNLLKEPLLGTQKDPGTVKTQKTKSNAGKTKCRCRYCNKTFLNAKELRNHIIEIHVKQKKTAEEKEPSSRVQCPKCPSTFSNSKHLQFHLMLLHVEKEEFPCLICTSRDQEGSSNPESGTEMKSLNFIFKDEISLNQHMKNIHYSTHMQDKNLPAPKKVKILIPKNKICTICSKSFYGKWAASNYRGHMQTHLNIKRYSCEHCSKKFATKMSLHLHLIRYHNYTREQLNLKYTCQLCPFITTVRSILSYHMGRKHPDAQLQLGDQMNADPEAEPNQSNGNNPTESAVCFVCSKIQTSRRNLIQHLKEHRGEGRFYCDVCPRDYSMRMSLLIHLRMGHHKLSYCDKCFTSFTDAAAFNQHHVDGAALNSNSSEKGNSGASNLKCEICDTVFKSPCLLRIHTISHLKEIQQQESNFPHDAVVSADHIFKCSVCSKVFDRQSYLNAHLEIVHENPQECSRFQCTKCERNYKFVSELKCHDLVVHSPKINQQVHPNHLDVADGEFGFECEVCLTKFGTESDLTDHQDKFRSEVLCHICPAKFKRTTALTLHLRTVHKTGKCSRKYLCHICPSSFFRGPDLRKHVERVHEGKFKKRSNYKRADKNVENQFETLRECNSNSNNKVSADLLGMNPELEPNLTPSIGRSQNKAKITDKSLMCFVCFKMQSAKFNLTQHLKEHRGEQRAYCDLCPRDFSTRFCIMAHLKLDHHKLAYCKKCFTSFADEKELNQHLLHTNVPTLHSDQTTESQASENADSPASNLKCEICGESCKSPCLFKVHSISHLKEIQQQELNFPGDEVVSVENIFKCSVCPSAFDRQSYLDAHLNILHERPPFQCGKCERTYRSQNELKTHDLVVHSRKINQHINQNKNHTSEISDAGLAYKCSVCSSKFLTQSELTNHLDFFEPTLLCQICSTKFNSSLNLSTHIRRVHGSKNFVCGICLSKFSVRRDLHNHVQRVHEGKNKKTN